MSRSSKVRKFSCRVLDFRYIFLIFISRQNKLVCAQRASKKITRVVPLRVHLLEIRRLGEDLAFFPPLRFFSTTFACICSENAVHIGGFYFVRLAIYKRRVPDFIALFAFSLLSNAR